jgi:hypothetical protein
MNEERTELPEPHLLSALLVMGPHSEYLHGPLFLQDLIDQPMLDINTPRVSAIEIAH